MVSETSAIGSMPWVYAKRSDNGLSPRPALGYTCRLTMGMRREGREAAVMFLYQQEYNRRDDVPQALDDMFRLYKFDRGAREFAAGLVRGCVLHEADIEKRIRSLSTNWSFDRLDPVDRAILRLAVYEMLHRNDVPPVVVINEAIEIAKRFSSHDASRFINGVLDGLRQDLPRPARHPAG